MYRRFFLTKLITSLAVAAFPAQSLFCIQKYSTLDLFYAYLRNDADLKNYTLELEKAKLEYDGTSIDNGFDVTLSTGTVTLKTADGGSKLEAKPSASVSVPAANGLSFTASSTQTVTENSQSASDISLSVGIDLISETSAKRKVSMEKARRAVLEAERNLKNESVNSENEFYSYLKIILSMTSGLVEYQLDLYDDKINFEKIKAQGYSPSSSTYRLAELKVKGDEHDIESEKRELLHEYLIFYKECGLECDFTAETDFLSLVPDDIVSVNPVDIEAFAPDTYEETEEALWTHKINAMARAAEKTFTLGASAGYTFDNSNTGTDTADAGLSSTIGGITLYGGVSLPVDGSAKPSYTASATLTPNTFRKNHITKKKNAVSEDIELLAIESARKNLGIQILSSKQTLSDLQWEKETNRQNYEMYAALEKDLAGWYAQGIITESEYLSAKTNAQKYKLSLVMNDIEMIIYNDEITVMFTEQP